MAKIKAPNPVNGIHASLMFHNGEAETENRWLIEWFSSHGYLVEEPEKEEPEKEQKPEKPDRGKKDERSGKGKAE